MADDEPDIHRRFTNLTVARDDFPIRFGCTYREQLALQAKDIMEKAQYILFRNQMESAYKYSCKE